MIGWHYQRDGHEFEKALGVGDGQGSLACCSPWGHRVGHDQVTELTDYNTFLLRKIGLNCLYLQERFFFFFKFYFIFNLYIIVLVLPNIKMNPPQVYKRGFEL